MKKCLVFLLLVSYSWVYGMEWCGMETLGSPGLPRSCSSPDLRYMPSSSPTASTPSPVSFEETVEPEPCEVIFEHMVNAWTEFNGCIDETVRLLSDGEREQYEADKLRNPYREEGNEIWKRAKDEVVFELCEIKDGMPSALEPILSEQRILDALLRHDIYAFIMKGHEFFVENWGLCEHQFLLRWLAERWLAERIYEHTYLYIRFVDALAKVVELARDNQEVYKNFIFQGMSSLCIEEMFRILSKEFSNFYYKYKRRKREEALA
jgi:hypothetical protein